MRWCSTVRYLKVQAQVDLSYHISLGLGPGAGQARGSVVVPTMGQGGIQSNETIWTALSSMIPIASLFGLHLSHLSLQSGHTELEPDPSLIAA